MDEAFVVFGGSGFLGGALVERLSSAGRTVIVVDLRPPTDSRSGVTWHRADLADAAQISALAPALPERAVFVNLAARQYHGAVPKADRQTWFDAVNVHGAVRVAALAARRRAAGLVQLSSDMVYGVPDGVPVAEAHPLRPVGEYGCSKKAMEEAVTVLADEAGLRLSILRPRLISGSGRLGVFTRLFELVRRGLPVPLIGSGENHYQMVGVDDCARAIVLACEQGFPCGAFNLGSAPETTVRQLLRTLVRHAGSRSPVVPVPAGLVGLGLGALARVGVEPLYREQIALADRDFVVDTARARDTLGWSPARSDRDLLRDAWDHWLRHRSGA